MVFLHPLFLWLMVAAGLPVVIHLFSRKKAPPLLFGTIRFLLRSQTRTRRRQQLKDFLLLALRVSLLALLVAAGAVPLSRAAFFRSEQSVVILADDSFSMSAGGPESAWGRMQNTAAGLLASLEKPASVAVVFTSGRSVPFSRDPESALQAVRDASLSGGSGDLAWAVRTSYNLLADKTGQRTVYLLTDLRKHLWDGFAWRRGPVSGIALTVVDLGAEGDENVGIKSLVRVPGKNEYRVGFINWSGHPVTFAAALSGAAGAETRTISLPAAGEGEAEFELPGPPGRVSAAVRYQDWIAEDNRYYADFSEPQKTRLLLVSGSASPPRYLDSALRACGRPLEITVRRPSDVNPALLGGCDAVFLADAGLLSRGAVLDLGSYLNRGGSVVVFPGENVTPEEFNKMWAGSRDPLLPCVLEKKQLLDRPGRIAWAAAGHPLFAAFGDTLLGYAKGIDFRKVYAAHEADGGSALLRLESGLPLLCERRVGPGRMLVFTFAPEESWTNLPLKPFFPVLVTALVRYLEEDTALSAHTGQSCSVRVPQGTQSAAIVGPSGTPRTVAGPFGETLAFTPEQPGYWTVRFSGGGVNTERVVAVSPDWREGNCTRMTSSEIVGLLPGFRVTVIGNARLNELSARAATRDFSDGILWIVLLLAMIEIGASNLMSPSRTGALEHKSTGAQVKSRD